MLSQKETDDKLDSMKIRPHRNLLQLPVCSQYLPPAPSTSRFLQTLQLRNLHCLLHNKKITPLPIVRRAKVAQRRQEQQQQSDCSTTYRPELTAVVNRSTSTAELTSANQTAAKQAKRKLRSERHKNGTLTEQSNV